MMRKLLMVLFLIMVCFSIASGGESFTQDAGSGVEGLQSVRGIANTILGKLSRDYKETSVEFPYGDGCFRLLFEKHHDKNFMNADIYEIDIWDGLLGHSPYKVSRSGRNVTLSNASAAKEEAFKLVKLRNGRFGDDQYVNRVVFEAKDADYAKVLYNALVKFFKDAAELTWD